MLTTCDGDALSGSDLVACVQSLDYTDFRHLSLSEVVYLTTDQVATIPDDWWFSRISSDARAALTEPHVQALNVAQVGLRRLTEAQLDVVTVAQTQSLAYEDFRYLDSNQTPSLTPFQISTIPDDWWFSRIDEDARAALTEVQV